jgi:hypothetical protein
MFQTLRIGPDITDYSEGLESLFVSEVTKGIQDSSGSYIDRFLACSGINRFRVSPFHPRNAVTQLIGSLYTLYLTGTLWNRILTLI